MLKIHMLEQVVNTESALERAQDRHMDTESTITATTTTTTTDGGGGGDNTLTASNVASPAHQQHELTHRRMQQQQQQHHPVPGQPQRQTSLNSKAETTVNDNENVGTGGVVVKSASQGSSPAG